jgi:flagellum-specific ATP synthase
MAVNAMCEGFELSIKESTMDFQKLIRVTQESDVLTLKGRVSQVIGLVIESIGPGVDIGQVCQIVPKHGPSVLAEVVGFREDRVLLMPYSEIGGIGPGATVIATGKSLEVLVGETLLGRVLDGLGRPIDGLGPIASGIRRPVEAKAPGPLDRRHIQEPLSVGVRAIDTFLTCGKGQRVGIFAGSGVGKSTLLGMIARNTDADVNVIGLVGERGREVKEFIRKSLGEEGLKRSVVVVATSDAPALVRIKCAFAATAIAEYFRDQSLDVMLMMDSVTRFAMAEREIGLAIGEPPTSRGYTPSVFAVLPRLLERAGAFSTGSITAFYTILVEGDDMSEPISDALRAILDGHVVLSRKLASSNLYPAIDVLESVSRVWYDVLPKERRAVVNEAKRLLATYRDAEDLINIGAYNTGSNSEIDRAIEIAGPMRSFLAQEMLERDSMDGAHGKLASIIEGEKVKE